MSTFLIANNNLRDLTDIEKAKTNLGIGTLASQDSNNVNITGGSIAVNELIINTPDTATGKILMSIDDQGTVGWRDDVLSEWATKPQNEVAISLFHNDQDFVQSNQLSKVAFTGDYNDLINIPSNITDLFETSAYLRADNNLQEITDPVAARNNLGLGSLATADTSFVSVSNLFVLSEFRFVPDPNQENGKFLSLDSNNHAVWVDIPNASTSNHGLIKLIDSYTSDSTTEAPTAAALRRAYYDLYFRVADTTEIDFVNSLIQYFGLLTTHNNLSEFSDSIDTVRENLGIGSLASQNTDNVSINNLTITNDFVYSANPIEGAFLKSGPNGECYWEELPIATIPLHSTHSVKEGLVKISHEYSANLANTVPSSYAISNMFTSLSNSIKTLKDDIPTHLSQLSGIDHYILAQNNLKDVNATIARQNLGLHLVAHTGDFNNLINKPTKLSQFENDTYLQKNLNLSDITNPEKARSNLGLGSMSLQNKEDVFISGGNATFENLTITKKFTFEENGNSNLNGKFLKAKNTLGEIQASDLPIATEEIYGTVKTTNQLDDLDNDKVASATLVYKTYNLLLDRIKTLEESLARNQYIKQYNLRKT
jgi:hypothetical protein